MKRSLIFIVLVFICVSVFSAQKKKSGADSGPPKNSRGLFTGFNGTQGDPNSEKKTGYTLKKILLKVLNQAPILASAKAAEAAYRAKIKQIKAERNPTLSITAGGSPIFHAPSSSEIDMTKWGVAGSASLSLNIPLYTFGRIPKALKAARSGLKVQRINTTSARDDLIFEIKKYYYGYLYAISIKKYIIEIAMSKVDKALDKTEKDYKKGKIKKKSLYSLRIMKMNLLSIQASIDKNIDIAETAFKTFLGIPAKGIFKVQDDKIIDKDVVLKPLNYYIKLAFRKNTQYRKAIYGLAARQALYEYEKTKLNPIFVAIMRASASGYTENIDASWIISNDVSFYIGFGIRYSTQFGKQGHVIDEKKALFVELAEKVKMLKKKLPIDVKKAYLDVIEARKVMEYRRKAFLSGKRWMMHTYRMFLFESATSDELRSGLNAYINTRRSYFGSIYNYYITIAELSKIVGTKIDFRTY